MLATDIPYRQYADTTGLPLDSGYIYFGLPNQNPETAPITVYWDAEGTQPATQPIRTLNGFAVRNGNIANVFADREYSITIKNAKHALVAYWPSSQTLSTSTGAALVGYGASTVKAELDSLNADVDSLLPAAAASTLRTTRMVNVEEYRQAGYTDQQMFAAAATAGAAGGFPIFVPPRSTQYALTADLSADVVWVIHPLADIAKRNFPSAVGSGGGYIAFNKNRLTSNKLYGQEQIDAAGRGFGKNFLINPYFRHWQRLDLSGASFVTASAPTYGDANTYSGSGGVRVWGPDGWYGKIWGGAYDAANPGVNAGAGSLKLERKTYGASGDFLDGSPYYLRSTFTGHNATVGQYTDPVYGLLDYGTNSVVLAGQIIRNARRTGKMTAKIKARWISGDAAINLRLTYCFGTGGSPNVIVNLQGFTLNADGLVHDYLVHFEVPDFTVDANGTTIAFGTAGTDYIAFEIDGGATGNCVHDYMAFDMRPGWGSLEWENCPASLDLERCRADYQIAKVAFAGSTVSGASHGGGAVFQPSMNKAPTVSLAKIDYNSGAFTGGVDSLSITGGGFSYATPPTVTISGGGGSGATATCTVSAGAVNSITLTAAGTGYTSPPTVSFSGGGGYGASASASLMAGVFGADKNGCQWWLKSGLTGNSGRVIAQLECNAQLVTR